MVMSESPAIEADGLGRRFGRLWAVRDVNFSISRGEIFGFVGPDGAGKTTLLQLLAAILDPTEGRCSTLGFDTVRQAPEVTSRLGYMPQGFTLYDRLTVAENLSFAAKARGVPESEFLPRRTRLLAMAGLSPFLHRREGALSGGMRKKLALCTNLIHEPPLLLLDEPGLGVDPLSRRELWRMLQQFRKEGATIVFSTSYMDEAELCDRVAFLDSGRIIATGSPDLLRSRGRDAVYSLVKPKRAAIDRLQRSTQVLGIKSQPGELRFVVDTSGGIPHELLADLSHGGGLQTAEPTMEDIFVLLRGGVVREAESVAPEAATLDGRPPAFSGAVMVETDRVSRRFGEFLAVDDVTLQIRSGEIFGLLGANGAGKTTLLRILCGLLPPSTGTARVADLDVVRDAQALRGQIGYMSQRFSLYLDLTAGENLAFFASAYGLGRKRAREAINWASNAVGLEELHARPVAGLSSAVRQRVALACSILHRPDVLFLDEPTSGVDPLARFRFWRLVMRLAAAGASVVVTTHYLEEAVYCHRLGLMHQGRLIAMGDLTSLKSNLGPDLAPATSSPEDVFVAYIEREAMGRSSPDARLA